MRRRRNNPRKKALILAVTAFVAIFMATGYSILSQRLTITGEANLYASEKYLWHKIIEDYGVDSSSGLVNNSVENNKYSYLGTDVKNYITFNDQVWRILSIENDNTIKIVKLNSNINTSFDKENNEENSTYCNGIGTSGCNSWSQKSLLTNSTRQGVVANNSTVNNYLNTTFYSSIKTDDQKLIEEHNFYIGPVESNNNVLSVYGQEMELVWSGNIGLLSVSDIMSSINTTMTLDDTMTGTSYITQSFGSDKKLWTINMLKDDNNKVWTYNIKDLKFEVNEANKDIEEIENINYYYIALPVLYLDSLTEYVSGDGSLNSPFVIK